MNREFPKVAREALSRQTAGDFHPSSDVLNAYVERSLTAREREEVAGHLAGCTDCRETLFLVNSVVEEPAISPAVVPARSWRRWRWAIPAVALVAIVSAVFIQRQSILRTKAPVIVTTSREPEPEAAAPRLESQLTATPVPEPSNESSSKATPHAGRIPATTTKPVSPKASTGKAPTVEEMLRAASQQESAATMSIAVPAAPRPPAAMAESKQSAKAIEQSLLKAAPAEVPGTPSRNSFAGEATPDGATGIAANYATRLSVPQTWRITKDGQLERFDPGSGGWSAVMADQSVKFRVVAVVRNDVWAGGDGGALVHSPDYGLHWSKVSLHSGDHVEAGNVTTIKFNTPQQGTIVTESGSRWTTSDGGRTWTGQ